MMPQCADLNLYVVALYLDKAIKCFTISFYHFLSNSTILYFLPLFLLNVAPGIHKVPSHRIFSRSLGNTSL